MNGLEHTVRFTRRVYRHTGFLLILFGTMLCTSSAFAQSAAVSGRVIDPSGAVVRDAEVIITHEGTGATRQAKSNSEGLYSFTFVQSGRYTLVATAEGFKRFEQRDVIVEPAQAAAIDIRLEVGAKAETITVIDSTGAINTIDATRGNAFGTRAILQLPLEGRNVSGLLSLQAGVTFTGNENDPRSGRVNGARPDQSNIILDGVDVNDQQAPSAFKSVLRNTLDSVQEFRVITTNANADRGRTAGAQIDLVTKSGTNQFHASAYEFHRNTVTSANDFFANRAGVKRPKLVRNVFGVSLGGPIVRDRAFFFSNFEGRTDRSEQSVIQQVPMDHLRNGFLRYRNNSGGISELSPAQIRAADPLGIGASPAILEILNRYPHANDTGAGDGLNYGGYRFVASTPLDWKAYVAKLDWTLDGAGHHSMFLRGNLQDDRSAGAPQFPGQEPLTSNVDNSRGLAFGYNAALSSTLTSSFRYGLTRQGTAQNTAQGNLRTDPISVTAATLSRIIPVHTVSEDLSWSRSTHNIQFGGVFRSIRNRSVNSLNSMFSASRVNWAFENGAAELRDAVPDLDISTNLNYFRAILELMGPLSQANARYNYDIDGNALPIGSPLRRTFGMEEFEAYLSDTWRVSPSFTITAGLRFSLMPPVREVNGVQVSLDRDYGEFFATRLALADAGIPSREAGRMGFVARSAPGGRPLYETARNFAPRIALAYSPQVSTGPLATLFGGPGRTSIRAGFGIVYDLFGMNLMNTLDQNAYGLTSTLITPVGRFSVANAPRFTSVTDVPAELIPAAPPGGPGTPPDVFSQIQIVDQAIRPPYSMNLNFSVSRAFGAGVTFEAAYVGRLSRRGTVIDHGGSQPMNFRDPQSGMRMWEAADRLDMLVRRQTPVAAVTPVPFWENLYSNLAGNGLSATQAVYRVFQNNPFDASSALVALDSSCSPGCSDMGPYLFLQPQFWGMRTWRSLVNSNYHSMQLSLRKRFSQGIQFDVNYTWSKAIDLGEVGIINSLNLRQQRAVSDFDLTHQVNANWVWEMPLGRGQRFGPNMSRFADAILGGWQISGLLRLTSGFPFSVDNGYWPTAWCCRHYATAVAPPPPQTNDRNAAYVGGGSGPNIFSDPAAALKTFDFTRVGQIGSRNLLRGDGLFGIDVGLGKRFALPLEGHSIQIRAEAFNVTNTPRFGRALTGGAPFVGGIHNPGTFGNYTQMLNSPRVFQFGVRYEF